MKQKPGVFGVFWNYADFLIKRFALIDRKEFIERISYPLFKNVMIKTLNENQKFDFSISSKKKSLRFSFNDFGERETSYNKYLEFFSNFPENCDQNFIKEVLAVMEPHTEHQTTIGAELGKELEEDRVKLYFEDFSYSNAKVQMRLRKLLDVLGISFDNVMKHALDMQINAIGIDFFHRGKIEFKVYIRHTDPKQDFSETKIIEFQKDFPPIPDEFYLIMFRFDKKADLVSKKLYKVFNISKYPDKKQENFNFIARCLGRIGFADLVNLFAQSRDFLTSEKIEICPVLYSEDLVLKKADVYFTIRKKIEKDSQNGIMDSACRFV